MKAPLIDVGEQRIYHLTHKNNLAAILSNGSLVADATPDVDISSPQTRERRRSIAVTAEESAAEFVPFFLTPNPTIWEGIRSGEADPRLSGDVVHSPAADFVLLVSTVSLSSEQNTVVADGDAAGSLTRFSATREAGDRMLRRLQDDEDSIIAAEYLVKDAFPFDLVTLIGVANDKARNEIKAILKSSGFSPKVAVYPPWFQRPDAE